MLARGAILVERESEADMCIVDDARKNLPTGEGYFSYKFIEESLKKNRLENTDDYIVGTRSAADRQVGSVTIAVKGRRNPFSKEDDQILFNWLEPFRRIGGKYKGNEIYKQLQRKHPQHTFQSWRSRYLTVVINATNMAITEEVDPSAQSDTEDTEALHNRSPKRRRLNRTQPTGVQDKSRTSSPKIASAALTATVSAHDPPRAVQSSKQSLEPQEEQRNEPVSEASKESDSATRQTETQSIAQNEPPDPYKPVQLSNLSPRNGTNGEIREEHHLLNGQTNVSLDGQASNDLQDETESTSVPGQSKNCEPRTQPLEDDRLTETVPGLPVFLVEERQALYRAVPQIQNTEPELLEISWKKMAEYFGQHTLAEWRLFYEIAILPEYMRRNKLETPQDLKDHVRDVIALQESREIKKEPETEQSSTTKEQTNGEMSPAPQEEGDSEMFFRDDSQSPRKAGPDGANNDNHKAESIREPSPILEPQTILRAVEVRQNGNVVAQKSSVTQSQRTPPTGTQTLVVSPKKKLFGRTIEVGMIGSQLQEQPVATDPTPPNESSFGTASTASALASVNSQSVSASKRPPESGQRPPQSMTTSQEEPAAPLCSAVQEEVDPVSILDVLTASDELSEDDGNAQTALQAGSPAVNLLNDGMSEAEDAPSSPVLSDTGSEYMPFDTVPERSQLWDPSQSEVRNEHTDSDNEEESEIEGFRIIQHSARSTPTKNTRKSPINAHVSPVPHRIPELEEDDVDQDSSGTEEQTEDEGSPELDVQVTISTKDVPRTETQALFQQSVPDGEDDITIFDVPPPEGGWEQFDDLEEDLEDIRTSVELADHHLIKHGASSSLSGTEETAPGPLDEEGSPELPVDKEVLIVSDHGSSHTTYSEDLETPTPKEVRRVHEQQPQTRSESDDSERTTSSHIGSSPKKSLERDGTEESSTSDEQAAIESWFSNQPKIYGTIDARIINRLASTALQATVLNLSSATFTLRDMIASFKQSEANRQTQLNHDTRIKQEHMDGTPRPKFRPKTKLTENEAKLLLPQDVLGVWTIEDDRDFLSQTIEGLERVKLKHGATGVRKRAQFLRLRYGQEALIEVSTPKSILRSARRSR